MSGMRALAGSTGISPRLIAHLAGFAGANLVVGPLTLWTLWTDASQHLPMPLGVLLIAGGVALLAFGAHLGASGEATDRDY